MPDDRLSNVETLHPVPRDWSAAFAALPLETPDANTWQRLQHARTQPTRRWPVVLATAAALALAAIVPWRLMEGTTRPQSERVSANVATASVPADATTIAARAPEPMIAATDATSNHTLVASPQPSSLGTGTARAAGKPVARDATRPVASAGTQQGRTPDRVPGNADARAAAAETPYSRSTVDPELEQLYAESARLESLVSMARDDRVATGTAAALASAYDAQVAGIDASLIQPGVTSAQRTQLWRERVAALRELAGFESTQRLLAAQGERYDAMLVSID